MFTTPFIINPEDPDDSTIDTVLFLLSQTHINKDLLRHPTSKQIGIGCACAGELFEGEHVYSCIIAVAETAPARILIERIPTYQQSLLEDETCSSKCEYLNDEPVLENMFTHYEELCDTGLWDENNYCVHCSEQTYQCSQCNTDLECTHCSAEMADGNDVTFSPYTNPNGELSCLIPACVQTDPENYLKCIECDQDESNPLFFLAR